MSATTRARELRSSMSKPEVLLWTRLKVLRALGYHMRRQTPLGPYFADFLCKPAKLVIEIDGRQHLEPAAHQRDLARDHHLATLGFETIRFHADDVLRDPDDICRQVLDRLRQRHPNPTRPAASRRSTLPASGEG